jgi:hypothetical protein
MITISISLGSYKELTLYVEPSQAYHTARSLSSLVSYPVKVSSAARIWFTFVGGVETASHSWEQSYLIPAKGSEERSDYDDWRVIIQNSPYMAQVV